MSLGNSTNFALSANKRDIVTTPAALIYGTPQALNLTVLTPFENKTVSSEAFFVTAICDRFTTNSTNLTKAVAYADYSNVTVSDLVKTFYRNCNGLQQNATSCNIITDSQNLSYNKTTGNVIFVKGGSSYVATFKANCTMQGTKIAVLS